MIDAANRTRKCVPLTMPKKSQKLMGRQPFGEGILKISTKNNMGWTIFILAGCLIGVLSVQWSSVKDLPGIISLALSLSSLVLAVIAIIQALTSSDGLNRILMDVVRAAENAKEASEKVEQAGSELVAHVKALAGVPVEVAAMKRTIESWSTQNTQQAASPPPDRSQESGEKNSVGISHEVFVKGTNGTLIGTYIAFRMHDVGGYYNCSEILDPGIGEYYNGVIASLGAVGAIETTIGRGGKIRVRGMGDFDKGIIRTHIETSDDEFVEETVRKVDDYFDGLEEGG